jgi:hypothetical protein
MSVYFCELVMCHIQEGTAGRKQNLTYSFALPDVFRHQYAIFSVYCILGLCKVISEWSMKAERTSTFSCVFTC